MKSHEKSWESPEKVLKISWENPEKILRKSWESSEKSWESPSKVMKKSCENPEKVLRKSWENPLKILLTWTSLISAYKHQTNKQTPEYRFFLISFVGLGAHGKSGVWKLREA